MKDLFNRDITYLRLSITDLCNLRCKYCMPEDGIEKFKHKDILSFEEIVTAMKNFVEIGIKKIRLTGGEPLVRKDVRLLFKELNKIDGLEEIAITTNGILLSKFIDDLYKCNITRINVSLDTLNKDKFREMTRGGDIDKVLEGIKAAIKYKMKIKVNIVHIGGYNDDEIEDFINMTKENDIDVRFIELMPTGEAVNFSKDKFISNSTILKRFPQLVKVDNKKLSGPAQYYQIPNYVGKVGVISPISNKFCNECNRIRLTAKGELMTCLHSNNSVNIREHINNKNNLAKIIRREILKKPFSHELENKKYNLTNMVKIGG